MKLNVWVFFSDDYNFPRSWMIPVIRDNVYNTELGFFTSYFLPLAAKFRQRGKIIVLNCYIAVREYLSCTCFICKIEYYQIQEGTILKSS